jgi:hypothetical protein
MKHWLACGLALTALISGARAAEAPATCYWPGDGSPVDMLREVNGKLHGGVGYAPARVGQGFSFAGTDGAVNLPDDERLRFTQSVTIRAWVKCTGLPPNGQDYAQILFRGDDRGGMDPYFLGIRPDGTLTFGIDAANGDDARVAAPFPVGEFVHVTASLDHRTGLMRLLYGDQVMAEMRTPVRPLRDLDASAHPGIAIGNHARQGESIYNMPFRGIIDEVVLSGETTLALESLTLGPPVGGGFEAELRLQVAAPPGGARVELTGEGGRLPMTVTIPAGQRSVRVRIRATSGTIALTARYNGSTVSATRELSEP